MNTAVGLGIPDMPGGTPVSLIFFPMNTAVGMRIPDIPGVSVMKAMRHHHHGGGGGVSRDAKSCCLYEIINILEGEDDCCDKVDDLLKRARVHKCRN